MKSNNTALAKKSGAVWGELPRWLSGKESARHAGAAGDTGLIPGSGRYPGVGNGNPIQYFCHGNPMDKGA